MPEIIYIGLASSSRSIYATTPSRSQKSRIVAGTRIVNRGAGLAVGYKRQLVACSPDLCNNAGRMAGPPAPTAFRIETSWRF
ncbi:MAG: hypothetical protein VB124_04290 [Burkholderia sp.]